MRTRVEQMTGVAMTAGKTRRVCSLAQHGLGEFDRALFFTNSGWTLKQQRVRQPPLLPLLHDLLPLPVLPGVYHVSRQCRVR